MIDDDDVEAFLEHHGVKGMHWGIRNDEEPVGESEVQKALKANPPPKQTPAQKAHHAEVKKAHDSHFNKSEAESPKGWRPTKKQVALIGIGAVAAAAIIGGAVYKAKTGVPVKTSYSSEDYLKVLKSDNTPGWVHGFAGKKMSPTDYAGLVENSTGRTWESGHFLTKESFSDTPISYPNGHQFLRLSYSPETSFGKSGTYAVGSEDDFARYLFTNEFGKKSHQIAFAAKEEIQIASPKEALDIAHASLISQKVKNPSAKDVVKEYETISGKSWSTPKAKSFIKELLKRGYDGIVDQMDVGSYGERPLVLFDDSEFDHKVATEVGKLDLNHFKEILTDIPNRR